MRPTISVVIPVYNGEDVLPRCLDACANQEGLEEDYEIVVVDNGSTDATIGILKEYSNRYDNVRYLKESKRSSYAARNRALKETESRYLVFTDADTIPSRRWLASYMKCVEDGSAKGSGVKLIGGAVDVTADDGNACAVYDKLNYLNQEMFVKEKGFAATANLLVDRSVFDEVGEFDPDLISGGDLEFGLRATERFEMAYCPEAVVEHPARNSLGQILRKNFRIGIGFAQVHRKAHGRDIPPGQMIRHLVPNVGLLRPGSFPRLSVETYHAVPDRGSVRFKLLMIDIMARYVQFLGRGEGSGRAPDTAPGTKRRS